MPASNATSRFSDRVENYVRYRPGYPPEALRSLQKECGLMPRHVVADIASGTGIWTQMLLENGNPSSAVEPNAEMRQAGERLLAGFPKFTSIAGRPKATTLPDASVDFVTAAQAAHWFDRARARREFVRILKPGGWLVLLWNERVIDATPFLRDYEQLLLTYGTDYEDVRHERTTDAVNEFFDPAPYQERVFPMRQEFDYCRTRRAVAVVVVRARARSIRNTSRCCANCGESLTSMPSRDAWLSITRRASTLATRLRVNTRLLDDLRYIAFRRKILSHDARRIPPPRPCRGGLDRRLPDRALNRFLCFRR